MAGIEFEKCLREQLVVFESQRKALQDAIAKLAQVEAKIQAINLLRAEHSGEKHPLPIAPKVMRSGGHASSGPSISKLIVRALTEAGKPQTSAQLLAFIASHGRTVKNSSIRNIIHQSKLLQSVTPGVYGLVEWQ